MANASCTRRATGAARQGRRRAAWGVAPLLLVLLTGWQGDTESRARVTRALIQPCDTGHCMDATISYHLGETLYEALHNGIMLAVQTDVVVRRPRRLLWDKTIATRRLRHRLEYQVLSKRYRLSLPGGGLLRFASLEAALAEMGRLRALELPAGGGVRSGDYVHVRPSLDVEALPNPLKPIAYLQDRWQLTGPWTRLAIR